MNRHRFLIVLGFFILSAIFVQVQLSIADGFIVPDYIVPRPPRPEPIPPLNVKYHHVDVQITDLVSVTKVDQVFKNDFHRDIEGTYIFPLPKGANISKFSMYVGNEELQGQILSANEARNIYEDIVRRQQDPALLEYMGRNMFKARVYPIPANGEKRIKIDYSEILNKTEGLVEYYYTLNTERFSGTPLNDVRITIDLTTKQSLKSIYSPTHDIQVDRINDHHAKITYTEENTRPDRDFIMYYTLSEEPLDFSLISYKQEGEDGFFLGLASPSVELGSKEVFKKEIVFVIDVSGSMSGDKIKQAKDALTFCLNNLNPEDMFNIVSFSTGINPFRRNLITASADNIKEAKIFVDGMKAQGGTNINEALATALDQLTASSTPHMILFLTDGLPTVGETDINRIFNNTKSKNTKNARIFVFGVGYDVNTDLLDKLALENNGSPEYVKPNENIEVKVSNLYGKISNPVLTDIKLTFTNVNVYDIYPVKIPDLFKGSQLLIVGRYKGSGSSVIKLTGNTPKGKQEFVYEETFTSSKSEQDFVPRLWASRKIAFLIDEIRYKGESKELVDEVVRLSKEFGIITEYTSFLVDADAGDITTMRHEDMRNRAEEKMRAAKDEQTGAGAVARAKKQAETRSTAQAPATATQTFYDADTGTERQVTTVRQVSTRAFYQRSDKVWVDSRHTADKKVIQVKSFSEAYFQLSRAVPEINQYLSIGKNVIVNFKNYSVQFGDTGKERLTDAELKSIISG